MKTGFHAVRAVALVMAMPFSVLRAASPEATEPASPGEEGRRAYELLDVRYRDRSETGDLRWREAVDPAFRDLQSDSGSAADSAAAFLMALYRQAAADEQNGRAEWRATMFWGGGAESSARQVREALCYRLEKSASGPATVPLAEWMLRKEERFAKANRAGVAILGRTMGPAADAALARLLRTGTPLRTAVVMALEQAGSRGLKDLAADIRKWTLDPRKSVREAAEAALRKLGAEPGPAFTAADGFTPEIRGLLRDYLLMMEDPLTDSVPFGQIRATTTVPGADPVTRTMKGWLRAEKDGTLTFTSWAGGTADYLVETGNRTLVFEPLDAAEAARELLAAREAGGRDKLKALSSGGAFTSQFESALLTEPEALLSAWLFLKGDEESAATLFFPRLDGMDDLRWAREIVRDLAGGLLHRRMLGVFSYERDYPQTIQLAARLSLPLFDGYRYQDRAKELAAQLAARKDDFLTLTLPSGPEWQALSGPMTRAGKISYLTDRLRLLNCFQTSQPGDVNFRDAQYAAAGFYDDDDDGAPQVINPFNELQRLRLLPADIPALLPSLLDENFLPTFSYWRDFHPDRTLHRVSWLAGGLINDAAMHELVDMDGWQSLPVEERQARAGKAAAWCREFADKSPADVLRSLLEAAADEDQWFAAAGYAARKQETGVVPDLVKGAARFPEAKARIAEICSALRSPESLSAARFWIRLPDARLKLFSSLILARNGTAEDRTKGLETLRKVLASPWDDDLQAAAVEPLLEGKDEGLAEAAAGILRHPDFPWGEWIAARIAHRLFLHYPALTLPILTDSLDSTRIPERNEESGGKETLTAGDRAAMALGEFRKDFDYPESGAADVRAAARKDLAAWLAATAAALAAGAPVPDLDSRDGPVRVPQWEIDAP